MKNFDFNNTEIMNKMKNAIETADSEAFVKAQTELAGTIEASIIAEARTAISENMNNAAVMARRGMNPLTKEEMAFYNEVIEAGGFEGIEKTFVPSIFERVFEDLVKERPILGKIDFVNATGLNDLIVRDGDVEAAWFGPLTEEIKKKLAAAFKKIPVNANKLSAYLPVSKAMLDLGPAWLDRYVRALLVESLGAGLESAIFNGTGKNEPIGILKDLEEPVVAGEYADKVATPLDSLNLQSISKNILATLTNEGTRIIGTDLVLAVNPFDYWNVVIPSKATVDSNGNETVGHAAFEEQYVQSVAVPAGTLVAFRAKDYFLGVASAQKIEASDHAHFIEDERVYLAKQYVAGGPKNNEALVFDISGIVVPVDPEV